MPPQESHDIEALRARLNICRQQLQSNSAINTSARKNKLRQEIRTLELQIAQVLGIKADEDEEVDADTATTNSSSSADPFAPTSILPMQMLNRTSNQATNVTVSGAFEKTPPIMEHWNTDISVKREAPLPTGQRAPTLYSQQSRETMNHINHEPMSTDSSSTSKPLVSASDPGPASKSTVPKPPFKIEPTLSDPFGTSAPPTRSTENPTAMSDVESIRSALQDAGEDDVDLDTLLREQAQMEQRLATLKRRREEEDETLARSIQEEEMRNLNRPIGRSGFTTFGTPFTPSSTSMDIAPSSSPGTLSTPPKPVDSGPLSAAVRDNLQARLDRARQERMDEEMARIFAESEAASFDLDSTSTARPTLYDTVGSSSSSSSASSQPTTKESESMLAGYRKQKTLSSFGVTRTPPQDPSQMMFSIFRRKAPGQQQLPDSQTTIPQHQTPQSQSHNPLLQQQPPSSTQPRLQQSLSQSQIQSGAQSTPTPTTLAASARPAVPQANPRPATSTSTASNSSPLVSTASAAIASLTKAGSGRGVSAAQETIEYAAQITKILEEYYSTRNNASMSAVQKITGATSKANTTAPAMGSNFSTNRIDLTRPMVDLTKSVIELHSSDEERNRNRNQPGPLGVSKGAYPPYYNGARNNGASSSSNAANGFKFNGSSNTWRFTGDVYQDTSFVNSDSYDEDSDCYDEFGWDDDSWILNQLKSWGTSPISSYRSSGSSRVLTPSETEKELRALLSNIQAMEEEMLPKDRTGTPEGMASNIVLLEHQKIGLTWLQKMEDSTNRGGILADDMGLGKTIQSIALIVSRPPEPIDDPVIWDSTTLHCAPPPEELLVKAKTTLVVAPVALVYQWAEELRTRTQPGLLKVHIYHGNGKGVDPEFLRRHDVVITTPNAVSIDMGHKDIVNHMKNRQIGSLFKIKFHRIIIDEAHVIKNKDTKASKACACLAAHFRWCLTGTPVQNNVDELFSLIRFLRIKPYNDWDEFRTKISNPMKKYDKYGPTMQRVQALLKAVCLRRTKTSTVDGKPILELPPRNITKVATEFSTDERAFYDALETRTRERFNAYVKAGTVLKNYSNACCHPHLITDYEKIEDLEPDKSKHVERLLDSLVESVRRRLMSQVLDVIECPICMDVGEESIILSKCGHVYCRDCITAHLMRHEDDDRKCPECRGLTKLDELVPVSAFNARFKPLPPPETEDIKGKGKAADQDGEGGENGRLPAVRVPVDLDKWISSSKIERLITVIHDVIQKREKVIVFSQFTSLLSLIERPLREASIPYLKYDGKMTAEARNNTVLQMMDDPKYSVMLVSLKCGSLGLNLTCANHVVIMDPWWNPALENQAIDRVHRIGQRRPVHVHRLCVPETVEDRILVLQQKKQAIADGALGEGEVPKLQKLGLQELMYLFRG
ncbi:hypothetical protein BGW38_006585, partial [Lunasporangiospora selenospora]